MSPRFKPLQVHIKRHPVITIWIALGVSLISAIIALLYRGGTSFVLQPFKDSLGKQDGIFLEGHIYDLDINSRTITISWVIGGCGSYAQNSTRGYVVNGECKLVNRQIDIYFNGGDAQNGSTWSYNPTFHPYNVNYSQIFYVQALNEFQTVQYIDIDSNIFLNQYWTQMNKYPFDTYFWTTSVVLYDPEHASEEVPIVAITPTDLANNFVPSVLPDSHINQTIITRDGVMRTLSGLHVQAGFKRDQSTKGFVLALFSVNWALSLVVLHITILSLVSEDVTMSEGVLILPVTVILTIPSLRALFPESPPFGIYLDNIGLFLQMIIVSVCSVILLIKISQHHLKRSTQQADLENGLNRSRSNQANGSDKSPGLATQLLIVNNSREDVLQTPLQQLHSPYGHEQADSQK